MTDLNVHEFGQPDGPALVLVHGLTDDGTCWPDAVARWAERWRIIAVDQRGHGQSPRFTPEQLQHAPAVLENDLVDVLRELGSPAILVGHSLGGLMAARVGAKHPDLVRAMVLEDPAKPTNSWAPDKEFAQGQIRFVEAVTTNPAGELDRMRGESPWSETELRAWAPAKALVDRRYLRDGLFLGNGAWEGLFHVIDVPTLIVVPVDGEMAPDPDRIANDHVRVVEIPDAGHCVRRDQPDAFHSVVDAFLDQHRS